MPSSWKLEISTTSVSQSLGVSAASASGRASFGITYTYARSTSNTQGLQGRQTYRPVTAAYGGART